MNTFTRMLSTIAILIAVIMPTYAGDAQANNPPEELTVDIPIKLDEAKVVFNMNHYVMRGDMPLGLRYMRDFAAELKESGTKAQIVAIFYSQAGHFTLNDATYNKTRGVTTGNPYKEIIAELLKAGVQLEECGGTMRNNNWTNSNLLPGIKVNTSSLHRLIQLEQQGFVQIQP